MELVRVAIWGTFDVDNYGDHLFPKIAARELARRLPSVVVDAYAPFGWLHPTRLDDGPTVGPLAAPTAERLERFASAYDLVLVGGGELIHLNDRMLAPVYETSGDELDALAPSRWFVEGLGPELEARCPVVWHAVGVPNRLGQDAAQRVRCALAPRGYVTVRDTFSRERLVSAGVTGDVTVVPDSALVVDRLWRMAADPPAGHLVVQGCDLVLDRVDELAAATRAIQRRRPGLVPLLLETGRCRGDGAFADAMSERLGRVERVRADLTSRGIAAVLRGAAGFVGTSLHAAITCTAFGRPFVLANLAGESKLDGFGALLGREELVVHDAADIVDAFERAWREPVDLDTRRDLQRRVDAHFDHVAELAQSSARRRASEIARPARPDLDRDATGAYGSSAGRQAEAVEPQPVTKTSRYAARARHAYAVVRARRVGAGSRLARRHG